MAPTSTISTPSLELTSRRDPFAEILPAIVITPSSLTAEQSSSYQGRAWRPFPIDNCGNRTIRKKSLFDQALLKSKERPLGITHVPFMTVSIRPFSGRIETHTLRTPVLEMRPPQTDESANIIGPIQPVRPTDRLANRIVNPDPDTGFSPAEGSSRFEGEPFVQFNALHRLSAVPDNGIFQMNMTTASALHNEDWLSEPLRRD